MNRSQVSVNLRVAGVLVALLLTGLVEKAQAGNGVVALQTADPSCPDDSGSIYVDCGNGTVTDNRTGLVWLANADCIGSVDWYTAMEFVAGLKDISATSAAAADDCGLSDGSSPGEWRLPSVDEWAAMVTDAAALGCDPTITDDSGGFCWMASTPGHTFSGVRSDFYWSSTTNVSLPANALGVNLSTGNTAGIGSKANTNYVWPVRGGQ